MVLGNIVRRATEFGTFSSRQDFLSFTLKIMFYIIPAVICGNYTDIVIKKLQEDNVFGDNMLYYISLQTLIIISTMYLIVVYLTDYTKEFHITIAGGYFIVLYFGIQTNYITMIKEYIS